MTYRHAARAKREAHEADIAVCARIRACRNLAGMTREDLATSLGLSYQQIGHYEAGRTRVSAGRLGQIAAALGRPVAAFFDPPADAPAGTVGDRETLDMARAFRSLPTRELRDAARRVIKVMAEAAAGEAATLAAGTPRKAA